MEKAKQKKEQSFELWLVLPVESGLRTHPTFLAHCKWLSVSNLLVDLNVARNLLSARVYCPGGSTCWIALNMQIKLQ